MKRKPLFILLSLLVVSSLMLTSCAQATECPECPPCPEAGECPKCPDCPEVTAAGERLDMIKSAARFLEETQVEDASTSPALSSAERGGEE